MLGISALGGCSIAYFLAQDVSRNIVAMRLAVNQI